MKRIEAFVPTIKRNEVVDAISEAGVTGLTIIESRGKGDGQRPMIRGAKGTARYVAGYNRVDTIISIVDDSKLDSVVSAIMAKAHTGSKGDGRIFVSDVAESYNICTKEKGL